MAVVVFLKSDGRINFTSNLCMHCIYFWYI